MSKMRTDVYYYNEDVLVNHLAYGTNYANPVLPNKGDTVSFSDDSHRYSYEVINREIEYDSGRISPKLIRINMRTLL